MAVRRYYAATRGLALFLAELFRVAFPVYYLKFKEAFEAGQWLEEDTGPWIGRAIIWKLQIDTHQDGQDGGPTACFNFGDYVGGEMYIPDLLLKLSLVIYCSGMANN